MKKIIFYSSMFICMLIISCKKESEELQKIEKDSSKSVGQLPHFDESNLPKISLDKLPLELKDAVPLPMRESKKDPRLSTIASAVYEDYYSPLWGGSKGQDFYIGIMDDFYKIKNIILGTNGSYITYMCVYFKGLDGTMYFKATGKNIGSLYSWDFASDEEILRITGWYSTSVNSLTFYTNKKSFKCGGMSGSTFDFRIEPGHKFLGFYGRSLIYEFGGRVLTSQISRIGFNVKKPLPTT